MITIKHDTWPLPNLKTYGVREFWHWMSIWTMPASMYVQSQKDEGGRFKPVVFIIDHGELIGGGFVVKCYYSGPKDGQQEYMWWRECEHEFSHKSGGNCYHIYTCKKCKLGYSVDSSD